MKIYLNEEPVSKYFVGTEWRISVKKALVFGAGGFAGGYMVDELLDNGYEVYGCSRYSRLTNDRISGIFVCDLLDADRVKTVISMVNPEVVVNMAGISSVGVSWRIPQSTVQVNVIGALNILEAVRINDVDTRILFIGSSEEYGPSDQAITEDAPLDASNPYGISKMMLEQYCRTYREHYGMNVYYVRAFNHTGVGQADTFVIPSWCKQVSEISKSGRPGMMKVGNLEVSRDFSDVRDIVRAYRMVIESDDCSQIYNIGSGKTQPLRKVLDYIIALSEQPITIEVNPKLIRPVENPTILCDHTKITQKLGWEPEIDIETTCREIFDHFNKR